MRKSNLIIRKKIKKIKKCNKRGLVALFVVLHNFDI